ncbi:MAG: hypothetical protein V4793_39300, partial [Paraburkholderia tropica]
MPHRLREAAGHDFTDSALSILFAVARPIPLLELIMPYQHIKVPAEGEKITVNPDFSLNVSNQPIIP